MNKLILLLPLLTLFLFLFPSQASAQFASFSPYCATNKTPYFLASWNIEGPGTCNVYYDGGYVVGRQISTACKGFNIPVLNDIVECGTYTLCAERKDDNGELLDKECDPNKQAPKCSVGSSNPSFCNLTATPTTHVPTVTVPPRQPFVNPRAGTIESVFGAVRPPAFIYNLGFGPVGINKILTVLVNLIYTISAIVFLFMIVISAFQWITSGGEKDKIAGAQKRITHAIIGITLLALAFFFLRLLGEVIGFEFFAI